MIIFKVPGEPQGKGRPRFARSGSYVRTYTPEKTASYENLVKLEYERQCGGFRFEDNKQLRIAIFAFYSIPKSTTKKNRDLMKTNRLRPTKKPDADNILKIIADSLNGIAYKDDAQFVCASVDKYFSETPCVKVIMSSVGEV